MKKLLTKIPVLIIFLAFWGNNASAQTLCSPWVDETNLVPFSGYSATNYYRNDDGHTSTITLPFSFCFYGTNYNTIVIDCNGFITFPSSNSVVSSSSSYEPQTFPITGPNLIAPFWADVDNSGNSSVSTAYAVYYDITPTHIIVEWDSVGYYEQHFNLLNSFEAIITNGSDPIVPNGNNLAFIYRTMQWAQGDVTGSGGFNGPNGAVVGVNDANGVNYMQFGIFDNPSNDYFGPNPPGTSDDGVAWLNNRELIMNTCNGHVQPIISAGGSGGGANYACDTFKLCSNNTITLPFTVWTPLQGKTVHSGIKAPVPPGVSLTYNVTTGQLDSLDLQVVANSLGTGVHTIVIYGYDNETPADSNFTTVTVDVLPKLTVNLSPPPSYCAGGSAVLTASGGTTSTYLWSTGATTSAIPVSPTVTTTYTVHVSNAGCTTIDTTITVTVNPIPVINVTPVNGSVCGGDSLQLTASGAATYTWAPTTGLSCSTCADPKAGPATAIQYTITGVSGAGCASAPITDSVEIHAKPTVTASTSQDSLCYGHSATLNVTGTGLVSYNWSPGMGLNCTTCASPTATPSVTTTYTVTGTDARGCSNVDSVYIYVTPRTPLTITGNHTFCLGNAETLTASGAGSTYTWQPGGYTGAAYYINPTVSTQYTVSMPTPCGAQTDSFMVYVNPKPVASFTSTPPDSGCVPLCVQFNDQSSIASGTIADWKWEYGTGDTLNTTSRSTQPHCYDKAGTFNVGLVVTSDSGCKDSVTQMNLINTFSHPAGAFTYSPQPVTILDPVVQFNNTTQDAYGTPSWHWNFEERGDTVTDTVSTLQNPIHTYGDTGTFCAQLVSVNMHGCVDTVINCVDVESQFIIYIPTGFTPNGDGKNDIFLPEGNFKTFEMYIYDRWGMEVFHTLDMKQGWNGQIKGSGPVAGEDTYIYLIKVTDEKNDKHSFTGEVNLIK